MPSLPHLVIESSRATRNNTPPSAREEAKGFSQKAPRKLLLHCHPKASTFRVLGISSPSPKPLLPAGPDFRTRSLFRQLLTCFSSMEQDFMEKPLYIWYDYFSCPQAGFGGWFPGPSFYGTNFRLVSSSLLFSG